MKIEVNPKNEYREGYISCEAELSFDETQSEEWKKAYEATKHIVFCDGT